MTNDDRVLTFKELKINKGWPYTAVHTRRLVLAGRFPKPFKARGSSFNLWFESEIDAYLAGRAKQPLLGYLPMNNIPSRKIKVLHLSYGWDRQGSERRYRIESVANSTEYHPRDFLTPDEVRILCDSDEWQVHIQGESGSET